MPAMRDTDIRLSHDVGNEVLVDPAEISSKHGAQLLAYWRDKSAGRTRPKWSDIELMDLYKIAPYMAVKDVVEDGQEFRNRYYGTELRTVLGYDGTGKLLREYYTGDSLDYVGGICRTAIETLAPVQSSGQVFWAKHREHLRYLCLYLPLDDEARTPAHLISVFDFMRG